MSPTKPVNMMMTVMMMVMMMMMVLLTPSSVEAVCNVSIVLFPSSCVNPGATVTVQIVWLGTPTSSCGCQSNGICTNSPSDRVAFYNTAQCSNGACPAGQYQGGASNIANICSDCQSDSETLVAPGSGQYVVYYLTAQGYNYVGASQPLTVSSNCPCTSTTSLSLTNGVFTCPLPVPGGSSCSYSCNQTYVPQGTFTCNNGIFTSSGSCASTVNCGAPNVPGAQSVCSSAAINQVCQFQCLANYVAAGVFNCGVGGVYNTTGACYAPCVLGPVPTNGQSACTQAKAGDNCPFTCQPGYTPSGSITCAATGTSFISTAVCSPNPCDPPDVSIIPHANSVCNTETLSGSTCAYTCSPGYLPSGPLTCLAGGWNPLGSCPACPFGSVDTIFVDNVLGKVTVTGYACACLSAAAQTVLFYIDGVPLTQPGSLPTTIVANQVYSNTPTLDSTGQCTDNSHGFTYTFWSTAVPSQSPTNGIVLQVYMSSTSNELLYNAPSSNWLAGVVTNVGPLPVDVAPIGAFEFVNSTTITGWVYDSNFINNDGTCNFFPDVVVLFDGVSTGFRASTNGASGLLRTDLPQYCHGLVGFVINLPPGQTGLHLIQVAAFNIGNGLGSSRTFLLNSTFFNGNIAYDFDRAEVLNVVGPCGGTLNPAYPATVVDLYYSPTTYGPSLNCAYTLTASSGVNGNTVQVTPRPNFFSLVTGVDYIKVYSNAAATTLVASWSASAAPGAQVFASSSMALTFITAATTSGGAGAQIIVRDYPNPVITSFSPMQGPLGSTVVTLTGTGFGNTNVAGLTVVTLGGVLCTAVTMPDASGTKLIVTVPAFGLAFSSSFCFVVIRDFAVSLCSTQVFTVVTTPTITAPLLASGGPNTALTITGTNFINPTLTSVTVSNDGACTVTAMTTTQIVCTMPADTFLHPVTQQVSVSNGPGFTAPTTIPFTYVLSPVLASISPSVGLIGNTVTLTGTNFGTSPSALVVTFNGVSCPIVTGPFAQTTVIVTACAYGAVSLTSAGVGTGTATFVQETPLVITQVTPAGGPAGININVAVTGSALFSSLSATIGSTACIPVSFSGGIFTCTVASGTISGNVVLYEFQVPSNALPFTVLPSAPVVYNVVPAGGVSGSVITINGAAFATSTANLVVTVGGAACAIVGTPSLSTIVCTTPALAAGTTANVIVTLFTAASNTVQWTCFATTLPSVTSLSVAGGLVGSSLTVNGHFGIVPAGNIWMTIGGYGVVIPKSFDAAAGNFLTALIPSVSAGFYTVSEKSYSTPATNSLTYEVINPITISGFSPTVVYSGRVITVYGANFGNTSSNFVATLDDSSICIVGTVSPSYFTCTVPITSENYHTITVTKYTTLFGPSSASFFVIAAPILSSYSPVGGVYDLGNVTLSGLFGTYTSSCVIANYAVLPAGSCTITAVSCSAITCTWQLVGGTPPTLTVQRMGLLTSSSSVTPVYLPAPIVTRIFPTSGNFGTVATLSGFNFGTSLGAVSVTFGSIPVTPTLIDAVAGTYVVFTVPVSLSGPTNVFGVLNGQTSSSSASFNVMSYPTITSVVPDGGPVPSIIVIYGTLLTTAVSSNPTVMVGGVNCPVIGTPTPTSVACNVPSSLTSLSVNNIVVTRDSYPTTQPFTYTVVPTIGISIGSTMGYAGALVTIAVTTPGSFTALVSDINVTFGTVTATVVPAQSTLSPLSSITVVAPPNIVGVNGTYFTVTLELFGNPSLVAAASQPYFYESGYPYLSVLTPSVGQAGTVLTLAGSSFGVSQTSIIVKLINASLTSSAVYCYVVPGSLQSSAGFQCSVQAAPVPGTYQVLVCVIGSTQQYCSPTTFPFTYVPTPAITQTFRAGGAPGDTLTITGQFFSNTLSDMTVTVDGRSCAVTSTSTSSLTCTVPVGYPNPQGSPIIVYRNGIASQQTTFVFYYAQTPVIISVVPSVVQAGQSITLNGVYFGSVSTDVQVYIGTNTTLCSGGTVNVAGTQYVCSVPISAVSGYSTAVFLYRYTSVRSALPDVTITVITPPALTTLSPPAGTASTLITMTGSNFGLLASDFGVLIGSLPCQVQSFTPDTSVTGGTAVCEAPADAITGMMPSSFSANFPYSVVLTRGAGLVLSAPSPSFTYTYVLAPVLTNIFPTGGAVGTPITLTGANFGTSSAASVLQVTVGGVACNVVGTVTSSQVVCMAPVVGTGAFPVVITVYGLSSTTLTFFTYANPPVITAITPTGGIGQTSGSTLMTLSGPSGSFGYSINNVMVVVGGVQCPVFANSLASDGSSVQCTVPTLTPETFNLVNVSIYGQWMQTSSAIWNQISVPSITSTYPLGGGNGFNTILTVVGSNFGAIASQVSVTVGGNTCPIISSRFNQSFIACNLPTGLPGAAAIVVNRLSTSAVAATAFTYVVTPVLSSISPVAGLGGMTNITLTGSNFGVSGSEADLSVLVGGVAATVVFGTLQGTTSQSSVVVMVPPASIAGFYGPVPVQFSVFNVPSATVVTFTYVIAPVIYNILPGGVSSSTALPNAGEIITVIGDFFGTSQATTSVTMCGTAAVIVTGSISSTQSSLQFANPGCPAGQQPVVITNFNAVSSPSYITVVVPPYVTAVTPSQGTFGTVLQVNVSYLGIATTSLANIVVTVGGVLCPPTGSSPLVQAGNGVDAQMITCTAPAVTASGSLTVAVSNYIVAPQSSAYNQFTYIAQPVITNVVPSGGAQGSVITILGTGLGTQPSLLSVLIGTTPCAVTYISPLQTSLYCTVPALTPGYYQISVTYSNVNAVKTLLFQVVGVPYIIGVTPQGGSGGDVITVTGNNFGPLLSTVLTIGTAAATISSVQLVTPATSNASAVYAIIATAPSLSPGQYNLKMTLFGVPSNSINFIYSYRPTLTLISPGGGMQGSYITLSGTYFNDPSVQIFLVPTQNVNSFNNVALLQPSWPQLTANTTVPGATTAVVKIPVYCGDDFVFVVPTCNASNVVNGTIKNVTVVNGTLVNITINATSDNATECLTATQVLAQLDCDVNVANNYQSYPNIPNGDYYVRILAYNTFLSDPSPTSIISIFSQPVIKSVSPTGGTPNALITIFGNNFGNSGSALQVVVGQQLCTSVQVVSSNTAITCVVSDTSYGNKSISVSRYGVLSNVAQSIYNVVQQPSLSSLSPLGGPGTQDIVVVGQNIDSDYFVNVFPSTLGTCDNPVFTAINSTFGQIACTLNLIASTKSYPLAICRKDNPSLCSSLVLYTLVATPVGKSFSPCRGLAGNVLTVNGDDNYNFGNVESALTITLESGSFVGVCKIMAGSLSSSGTSVKCFLPDLVLGAPEYYQVFVSLYELKSLYVPSSPLCNNANNLFQYISTPFVSDIQPWPPGGRAQDTVTLIGENFGLVVDDLVIQVGEAECKVVQLTNASVICTIQGGALAGPQPMTMRRAESVQAQFKNSLNLGTIPNTPITTTQVVIVGPGGTEYIETVAPFVIFQIVNAPSVSSVSPSQLFGGDTMTITGLNFFPPALVYYFNDTLNNTAVAKSIKQDVIAVDALSATIVEVTLDGRPCNILILSLGYIVCETPTTIPQLGEKNVVVQVYSATDILPHKQTYYLIQDELYYVKSSSVEGKTVTAFTILVLIITIVFLAAVMMFKDSPVIRAGAPMFMFGIAVGIVGSLIGVIIQIGPPSPSACMLRQVLPSMSLSLILANISVKTWRIWKIFDNKALKRVQIKDYQLVAMTCSLLAFEAIIFIVWFNTNPPLPFVNFGDWICNSRLYRNFVLALNGYKILLIIANAFLAYSVRQVKLNQFNESLHIAFSIYNILVVFVLVTILEFNINKLKPTFIISSSGTLVIMIGMLGTLYAPKLWVLLVDRIPSLRKKKEKAALRGTQIASGTSVTKLVSSPGMASFDHDSGSDSRKGSGSSTSLGGGGGGGRMGGGGGASGAGFDNDDNAFDWN